MNIQKPGPRREGVDVIWQFGGSIGVWARAFEAFPVVEFFGLMEDLSKGDWTPVRGDILEPCRPAVGEHEVGFCYVNGFPFSFLLCHDSKIQINSLSLNDYALLT